MQPLQEGIKKDIITHPNGEIEVIYEAGKTTLTAQDEALLAAFLKLNDFELELKETSDSLYKDSVSIRRTVKELRVELKCTRQYFDTACKLADKLSAPSFVFEETSLEAVEESREDIQEQLSLYNDKLLALYDSVKLVQERLNEYYEVNQHGYDPLFEAYEEIAAEHIENWQENSINTVYFDKQFDKFREFISFKEKNRDVLIDESRDIMIDYGSLTLETKALYDAWNEFTKRCDLLAAISDLHTKLSGFAEN